MNSQERNYGPGKYAALNLMLARWLRTTPEVAEKYCYVTLGGTELYDIANICWIDSRLLESITSYEVEAPHFRLAEETANQFKSKGINVEVLNGDIFQYRRSLGSEKPHIYYIDVTGVFYLSAHRAVFRTWFDREVIQPGDFILITSYLGARVPIRERLPEFDADFKKLRIESADDKAKFYEVLHPLFVLSRALIDARLTDELNLRCIGAVKYRANREPMGLYGILCESGKSRLSVMASGVPYFDTLKRDWFTLPAVK